MVRLLVGQLLCQQRTGRILRQQQPMSKITKNAAAVSFGNSRNSFSSKNTANDKPNTTTSAATKTVDFSMLEQKADLVMNQLFQKQETVGCAETSSGGLIASSLWSSPIGSICFKGGGIRLAYGISKEADARGKDTARETAAKWGILYEDNVQQTDTGTMEHALEIAHAAKFNLNTDWGIGESGIVGPESHRRSGLPPGMGFVAVAGPTPEQTGVMKLNPSNRSRSQNMHVFANAALDLMLHLQKKGN